MALLGTRADERLAKASFDLNVWTKTDMPSRKADKEGQIDRKEGQKVNERQKASILRPPGYEPGALPVAPCRLMLWETAN
ncbi:MAG: hypothetical protein Q9205_006778 [Flavoplaca limonia]